MAYIIKTITSCGLHHQHHQHYHILWPTPSTLSHPAAYIINTITSCGLHHQHYHIPRPTSSPSSTVAATLAVIRNILCAQKNKAREFLA